VALRVGLFLDDRLLAVGLLPGRLADASDPLLAGGEGSELLGQVVPLGEQVVGTGVVVLGRVLELLEVVEVRADGLHPFADFIALGMCLFHPSGDTRSADATAQRWPSGVLTRVIGRAGGSVLR
jgi:hypothetical protein